MNNIIFNLTNLKRQTIKELKNNQDIIKIQKDIKKEMVFQQNSINKLFVIRNIYPQKNNKYILDIYIKNSKNQNEDLINHVKDTFYQHSRLLKFLNENFTLNSNFKPLPIEFYYTKDFKPIILINKRGFHLIDFVSLLEKSNKNVTPHNFTFTSNHKIF
jgi:hypothetical protein